MSIRGNSMQSVVDEKSTAKHILESEKMYKGAYKTIELLIKYLYIEEGLKKREIEGRINDFLSENYDDYHVVETPDYIERAINRYWKDKGGYIKVESIKIAKSELEYIRSLDNVILEKILFVILVDAKRNNQITEGKSLKWTNRRLEDILKDAKIHGTYRRKFMQTHQIVKMGGIRPTRTVNGKGIEVKFMELDNNGEVAMELVDMRNYVFEYLKWRGENIGECEVCGIRIEIKGNRQSYCGGCWKEKERDLRVSINKKYYEKNRFKTV